MAGDLAEAGIRVNALCPGICDTPLTRWFIDNAEDPAATESEYNAAAPLGRMGLRFQRCPENCRTNVEAEAPGLAGRLAPRLHAGASSTAAPCAAEASMARLMRTASTPSEAVHAGAAFPHAQSMKWSTSIARAPRSRPCTGGA